MNIETHPFEPYIPCGARVLIMGTFPPQPHRWSMDFYYPNRTNDFWPMMGLIFDGNPKALFNEDGQFDLAAIKRLLDNRGIALSDTGYRINRLMNNASDKFLEIVEPVDIKSLHARMPSCTTLVTTGEKAAQTLAMLTASEPPRMGHTVEVDLLVGQPATTGAAIPSVSPGTLNPIDLSADKMRHLRIWRMPSTSRAYPLKLEKKAAYYQHMFQEVGVL